MPNGAKQFNSFFHTGPNTLFSAYADAMAHIVTEISHISAIVAETGSAVALARTVTAHIRTANFHVAVVTSRMCPFDPAAITHEKW